MTYRGSSGTGGTHLSRSGGFKYTSTGSMILTPNVHTHKKQNSSDYIKVQAYDESITWWSFTTQGRWPFKNSLCTEKFIMGEVGIEWLLRPGGRLLEFHGKAVLIVHKICLQSKNIHQTDLCLHYLFPAEALELTSVAAK